MDNLADQLAESGKQIRPERHPWSFYLLVAALLLQSQLTIGSNVNHISIWMMVLLALGVGQAVLLPPAAAAAGGLAAVVLWLMLRQSAGIWVPELIGQSLTEVIGLAITIGLAIRYRTRWERQQSRLRDLHQLQHLFVEGESNAGLLPKKVAELRMMEEVDRARQFSRPIGLLLVEIVSVEHPNVDSAANFRLIYHAVSRQLTSAVLVHDVPFRFNDNQLGVMLPERDWQELYRDADQLSESLQQATFIDGEGRVQPVSEFVQFYFGLGTYQGEPEHGEIDVLRAASDSLSISRNLAGLAENRASSYAMPAIPTAEPTQLIGSEA